MSVVIIADFDGTLIVYWVALFGHYQFGRVFGRIHNFVDQRCKEGNVAKDRGIHKLTEIAGLFFRVAGVVGVDGGDVGAFVTGYSVIIVVGRGCRFFVRIDIVTFGNGKRRLLDCRREIRYLV
jgi:hypothetical protein